MAVAEEIINEENRLSMDGALEALELYLLQCAYDYGNDEFILDTPEATRITRPALELVLAMIVRGINDLLEAAIEAVNGEHPIEPADIMGVHQNTNE